MSWTNLTRVGVIAWSLAGWMGCADEQETQTLDTAELTWEDPLQVMTINVRNPSDSGEKSFEARRPRIANLLRTYAPDVIGVQELSTDKLDAIYADVGFPYSYVGVQPGDRVIDNREGNVLAIFYRADALELLDSGHKGTRNSDRDDLCTIRDEEDPQWRGINYAHFRHSHTGRAFYVFNTHFPSRNSCERQQMAKILRDYVNGRAVPDPIIVLGDFNDGVNPDGSWNDSYRRIVDYLQVGDTYGYVNNMGAGGSFLTYLLGWDKGTFQPEARVGKKIDHIFINGPFHVTAAGIDRTMFAGDGRAVNCDFVSNGTCPDGTPISELYNYSDHWAVWASLAWP